MKPAAVISKRRDGEPEVHYLIGPQRETVEEAEDDLCLWRLLDLSPEDRTDSLTPEMIDHVIRSIRILLEGQAPKGASARAGRTIHRGPTGTRKGRVFIVLKIEDGEA